MTTASEYTTPQPNRSPESLAAAHITRIEEKMRQMRKALAAIKPFAKPALYLSRAKEQKAVEKLRNQVGTAILEECGLGRFMDSVTEFRREAASRVMTEIGEVLPEACENARIDFAVVSRESPLEVRLSPFSFILDLENETAEARFSKLPLGSCRARTDEMLALRNRLLDEMSGGFDPATFFDQCLAAYRAAAATAGAAFGARVEINDYLAYLAVVRQSNRFRADPLARNYTAYSRARFAFDLWQLVSQAGFERNGLRLNLGVATGNSTAQKSRVLFIEDDRGIGEYKLTVFFTPTEQ